MIKAPVFIIMCAFQMLIYSQTWAPIGAKWIYGHFTYDDFSGDPIFRSGIMDVVSDTVIQGKICSKIVKTNFSNLYDGRPSVEFMYQSNDSVYFFDTTYASFQMLYSFSANPGESWYIKVRKSIMPVDDDSIKITVNSVTSLDVNSNWLIQLDVTYYEINEGIESESNSGTVVQSLGDLVSMFNYPDPPGVGYWVPLTLRCYDDLNLGHFETVGINGVCYLKDDTKVDQLVSVLYPNPVMDELVLASTNELSSIVVYSSDGREMFCIRDFNQSAIDVGFLAPGIYLVLIVSNNGIEYRQTFIKL